ncbi:trihelix transcription factor ASR3-like isoform X2 [Hibiscus syriacus]|uniref:trihelix transcription factor ASR3-like isoform X2 n=1 Tax=Hibiscus syriacus TaxID=106335 RepID=UPI001925006C|nr:trihelix transcription factor ASR3-like isoform X2 [Hibiscus syriacus]
MHLMMMMADQGGNNVVTREYRKGNWSVHETMVLIEAKEMDYKRRMKRSNDGEGRGKPTELRWKWVEDYCGRKGCLRSQNQCNDKWDNLMRDYKKVREYQKRMAADSKGGGSYWEMEKNERKGNNLPSNMLRQIYERLEEVVEKKGAQTVGATAATPLSPPPAPPSTEPTAPSPLLQPPPISYAQPLPTVDSDTSEYSDSPAKRRRRRGDNGEGTSGGTGTGANNSNEVSTATAISKSASIIAEAIQASEEREERRHRDLLSFHERRLKIEESKTEISKQGINGLVDAINKLANSILALASHKNQSSAPK